MIKLVDLGDLQPFLLPATFLSLIRGQAVSEYVWLAPWEVMAIYVSSTSGIQPDIVGDPHLSLQP